MNGAFKFVPAAMAAVVLTGCQSGYIEPPSDTSEPSGMDADKPFVAVYGSDGSAEDTAAAADIIEKRLSAVYGGEFTVSAEGSAVTVELPDKTASEAEKLLKDIEITARLTFRMGWSGDIPEGGSFEELELVMTGAELIAADTCFDPRINQYFIRLSFDENGTEAFKAATQIAYESGGIISVWLDDDELIAPKVADVISDGSCVIQGIFSMDEAVKLAALMSSGELPVNLTRSAAE